MASRPRSRGQRLLLVEGEDELHVVQQIWERRGLPGLGWDIVPKGGIEPLLKSVRSEVKGPKSDQRIIGIVADADASAASRWQGISDRLEKEGIEIPRAPRADGFIVNAAKRKPRVGVWVMPDNSSAGELEDFVAQMVPEDDSVWKQAESFINGLPSADRKFSEHKTTRAVLHAWLATREDPRQIGTAIEARDLEIQGDMCKRFIAWLQRLFD